MPGSFGRFFSQPSHLVIFLPLLMLLIFVGVNYFTFPHSENLPQTPSTTQGTDNAAPPAQAATPLCPESFECCEAGGTYVQKSCPGGQECTSNKCEKAACPNECCDDESSRAQYAAKACDGNFLCEDNRCVQRKCWKECCAGDPAYEDKACPGIMECISNACQKPACPDNFLCCPADDSTYRQKDCPGRGVCKFRVCKSALSR